MASGEGFENWSGGVKNIVQILISCFLIALLLAFICTKGGPDSWLGKRIKMLSSSGVESVKIFELEVKLKQTQEAALSIANNPPTVSSSKPSPNAQDHPPTPNLAPALAVVSTSGTFWTYLGQQQGNRIPKPTFVLKGTSLPSVGDVLVSATDTYERDAFPVKLGSEWRLGKIVGVIRQGESITVTEVQIIEDGNVWLHVDPNQ